MINNWTLTRNEIIERAYRLIGVLSVDEELSASQIDVARNALHTILSDLEFMDYNPLRKQTFSTPSMNSSAVLEDGQSYECIIGHISLNISTWSASTNYSVGDFVRPSTENGYYYEAIKAGTSGTSQPSFEQIVGSEVDDNSISWRAHPDTKPGTGISWKEFWREGGSGTVAYSQETRYTSSSEVFLNKDISSVQNVWYRETQDQDTDIQIELISRTYYNQLIDKYFDGYPIYAYFDDSENPKLHLYPVPEDTDFLIIYDGVTIFNDLDEGSNTGESTKNFKNRWINYLTYELAVHLGEEYQETNQKLLRLERKAEKYKKYAIIGDGENINRRVSRGAF